MSEMADNVYPEGPLSPEAERDLMRLLRAGDEEAVRVVYARFGRHIYNLGMRLLGSPQAAEELVQDAFVAAWRKAASFDPTRGRLSTWLMTIAHNLAVDRLRRESRRPATPVEDIEAVGEFVEEPEHEALDRVYTARLLEVLTAAERRLLRLAYDRGWTAREISEHDDVPLGTVKTRLRATLIKLRRAHAWKREL